MRALSRSNKRAQTFIELSPFTLCAESTDLEHYPLGQGLAVGCPGDQRLSAEVRVRAGPVDGMAQDEGSNPQPMGWCSIGAWMV